MDMDTCTQALRDALLRWDPIGITAEPDWPADEYDCLIDPALSQLRAGATPEALATYLGSYVFSHFGLGNARPETAAAQDLYQTFHALGEETP